jgi:branched-chain amino acid transport system ATP-binding protein
VIPRPLLEVRGLSVKYAGAEAITDISISVAEREIVTVVGANGAGKSTLLNSVMGILPGTGEIWFNGTSLAAIPIERRVALGLSLVPEKRELFTSMTVEDNLNLGAFKLVDRRRIGGLLGSVYDLFPRLAERRRQLSGTLSGGERQMLAMGRALMGKPKLLMLDEPSLGLAPMIVKEVFRTILELRNAGMAILLVEQNARAALQVSDRGMVLENGRAILQGSSGDLAENPLVAATYLGFSRTA